MQLDAAKQDSNNDYYWMAEFSARLGNTNEVFSLLNEAYKQHNGGLTSLLEDYHWDGYRDDARFNELLDKVGFTNFMPFPKK